MNTDFVKKLDFIDAFCDQVLSKVIAKNCDSLATSLGCKTHYLHMKRENIASQAFYRAKKNYAMNVWDSEGLRFHEAHMKVTGLESVKASFPKVCTKWMEEGYAMILAETPEADMKKFILAKFEQYKKLSIADIALNIKADSAMFVDGADISGKSFHIRGGHLFNQLIKEHSLSDQPIIGGKIKYVLLKTNNKYQADAIAFQTRLPEEFGLNKFIDTQAMFEKSFMNPIVSCCNIVGMNIPDSVNKIRSSAKLSAFFG